MNLIPAASAQETTSPPAIPSPAPAPTAPAAPHPAPAAAPQAPAATTTSVGAPAPVDPNAPPPPTVPEMMQQLIPLFVVMAIVYVMVIRPRARKEKAEVDALRNVRRGDVISTTSGFVGKVTRAIDDNEIEFEIAPNVRARLLKSAIADVRSRGEPVRDTPPETPKAEAAATSASANAKGSRANAKAGGKSAKS